MSKRKNPKSCPPGKKLVKFKRKNVSFCASKSKKKGGKRKVTGAAKMSTAARKAMVRKACANTTAAKRAKMKGLCAWAKK